MQIINLPSHPKSLTQLASHCMYSLEYTIGCLATSSTSDPEGNSNSISAMLPLTNSMAETSSSEWPMRRWVYRMRVDRSLAGGGESESWTAKKGFKKECTLTRISLRPPSPPGPRILRSRTWGSPSGSDCWGDWQGTRIQLVFFPNIFFKKTALTCMPPATLGQCPWPGFHRTWCCPERTLSAGSSWTIPPPSCLRMFFKKALRPKKKVHYTQRGPHLYANRDPPKLCQLPFFSFFSLHPFKRQQ